MSNNKNWIVDVRFLNGKRRSLSGLSKKEAKKIYDYYCDNMIILGIKNVTYTLDVINLYPVWAGADEPMYYGE
jgi:hypothetical protein